MSDPAAGIRQIRNVKIPALRLRRTPCCASSSRRKLSPRYHLLRQSSPSGSLPEGHVALPHASPVPWLPGPGMMLHFLCRPAGSGPLACAARSLRLARSLPLEEGAGSSELCATLRARGIVRPASPRPRARSAPAAHATSAATSSAAAARHPPRRGAPAAAAGTPLSSAILCA